MGPHLFVMLDKRDRVEALLADGACKAELGIASVLGSHRTDTINYLVVELRTHIRV
jgi:hypothetical protein